MQRVFGTVRVEHPVSDQVQCSECGTSYDSDEHPFCPRCGSTAHKASMPGALASARRHDPSRRRVQASGAVLLAIGMLFLIASIASALVPQQRAAESVVDALASQPGGMLTIEWPTAEPATLVLVARDGTVLANTTVAAGHYEGNATRAVLVVHSTQGNTTWNQTVVVLAGDSFTLRLPANPGSMPAEVVFSPLFTQVLSVARYVSVGLALVLCVGGACALLLRLWPLAAVGAIVGMLLGLLAMVGFLVLGLLFAIPFALCGILILRGRRHFVSTKA
ncbi:MAG: hypothetical protein WC876_09710 [Candidatus Thermoplasmatota archaeon]|jgi:hypothetical protein